MHVRVARREDYDPIVALVDDWWGRALSSALPRLFFDHFHRTSRVAEDEIGIAAVLVAFISPSSPDISYIHFIGVRPDQRRNGLARSLYEQFADYARACGCRELRAITSPVNTRSIRFHESLGFAATGPIAAYDGPGRDKITFHRQLV